MSTAVNGQPSPAGAREALPQRPRILVTGGTGFVGGHVCERLAAAGWHVRALVRPSSDVTLLARLGAERIAGDLATPAVLERAVDGVDAVLHLAAVVAAGDEATYRAVNAEGTRRLVAAVRAAGVRRLVYLSSYAAGGPALDGRARHPAAAPAPLTAYGRSKLAGEAAAREAASDGVEVVVLRAPVVYGPRDRGLLPYFRLVRRGLAPLPAGPDRLLQLLYAPDLAWALQRAARRGEGAVAPGVYAVADPAVYTWSQVARAIGEALGRRPRLVAVPVPLARLAATAAELAGGHRPSPFNREKLREMLAGPWVHDLGGAERLLPPAEVTPLAAGLAATARWYAGRGWR